MKKILGNILFLSINIVSLSGQKLPLPPGVFPPAPPPFPIDDYIPQPPSIRPSGDDIIRPPAPPPGHEIIDNSISLASRVQKFMAQPQVKKPYQEIERYQHDMTNGRRSGSKINIPTSYRQLPITPDDKGLIDNQLMNRMGEISPQNNLNPSNFEAVTHQNFDQINSPRFEPIRYHSFPTTNPSNARENRRENVEKSRPPNFVQLDSAIFDKIEAQEFGPRNTQARSNQNSGISSFFNNVIDRFSSAIHNSIGGDATKGRKNEDKNVSIFFSDSRL